MREDDALEKAATTTYYAGQDVVAFAHGADAHSFVFAGARSKQAVAALDRRLARLSK